MFLNEKKSESSKLKSKNDKFNSFIINLLFAHNYLNQSTSLCEKSFLKKEFSQI